VGAADIVAAAQAGEVVQPERDKLAAVLRDWMANPASADLQGQRGREWVESHYSWDTIAEQMESSYRSIIENNRR